MSKSQNSNTSARFLCVMRCAERTIERRALDVDEESQARSIARELSVGYSVLKAEGWVELYDLLPDDECRLAVYRRGYAVCLG